MDASGQVARVLLAFASALTAAMAFELFEESFIQDGHVTSAACPPPVAILILVDVLATDAERNGESSASIALLATVILDGPPEPGLGTTQAGSWSSPALADTSLLTDTDRAPVSLLEDHRAYLPDLSSPVPRGQAPADQEDGDEVPLGPGTRAIGRHGSARYRAPDAGTTRTSGSTGGRRKRASRKLRTTPRSDLDHCRELMIAQNARPKIIQSRLGHSSITVTLDTCRTPASEPE